MSSSTPTQTAVIDTYKSDVNARIEQLRTELIAPPTPTPTPTPTPGILLQDDFSDSYPFVYNTISKNKEWFEKYIGSGKVAFENGLLHMVPKTATNYYTDSSGVGYETYACQIDSTKIFGDFKLDIDVKLNKQLRTGYSKYGINQQGPQPWETIWIFFRFTTESPKSNHHYYYFMGPTKAEFGKKDNKPGDTTVEQQLYLPEMIDMKMAPGVARHVTILCKGFHIEIIVDGIKAVSYDDRPNDPEKMSKGQICIYTEDADVSADNVKVVAA